MMVRFLSLAVCAFATACTSGQLSYTTVNVASTIEDIEVGQTISNLSRTVDQPYAFPSEVVLSAGTIQVLNTVSPSLTFPLSNMFVNTVSATPSGATTTAGAASTLGASVSWQQNFNITPITDPFTLRNLGVLYRAVALCDKPDPSTGEVKSAAEWLKLYVGPRVYNRSDNLVPDPYYLEKPNCVRCLIDPVHPPKDEGAIAETTTLNEIFNSCWLMRDKEIGTQKVVKHYDPDYPDSAIEIGSAGGHIFYVQSKDYVKFQLFMMLKLPYVAAPMRFSSIAAPAADDKGKGKATAPAASSLYQLTIPRLAPGPAEGARPNSPFIAPGIQPSQ